MVNWFTQGGSAYAAFRPHYPPTLAQWLARQTGGRGLALDVGCGSGQLTCLLAPHFDTVVGVDPSASQLQAATPCTGVRYLCAPAESLPAELADADLVTVAQAAHWLDLSAFYAQVRGVARPGATLALITYDTLRMEGALDASFQRFYAAELAAYWPPQRRLVETGYRTIEFPFDEFPGPDLAIHEQWNLAQFLGYLGTFSAVRRLREAGQEAVLERFAREISGLWGDPATVRTMTWPLRGRYGGV